MPVRPEISSLAEEMRAWRRHLHAHPETAFEEHNTAEFVAGLLSKWGIEVDRGLAGTGVVGSLRAGSGGRTIGLRADMDALNLEEENGFEHRSQTPGKMHACGHDGHVAMLLGAAHHLARTRSFQGTVHFIFQPAEENEAGGRRMVAEGLFDRFPVDAVYGMHNMPFLPEGRMVVQPGPIMASADFFEITLTGKGAHGAWPHQGIDAISVASQIVIAFNHIVARMVDPLDSVVISVTKFRGGHTTNVIPETVTLAGTARALTMGMRELVEARMRQVCEGIAATYGMKVGFDYQRRYPPTINNPEQTRFSQWAADRVVGDANVIRDQRPIMGAEDFGWMLLAKAGCYVWLGSGREQQVDGMLHSPRYDFNDRVLPVGASYWVELVEGWLRAE